MNILQVVAKPTDSAEVARSVSSSLNHLPFRPQYCLRISCYAGIEKNMIRTDVHSSDGDKYRANVDVYQLKLAGGNDLLCGVVHLHGRWLGRRPCFLQLRSVNLSVIIRVVTIHTS